MCEQSDPRALVDDLVRAEQAGFDCSVASDHYFPWLDEQGHSPYVWSVLGAAAQASERIPLMTYVTCPSFRYHPAVVAQKAATVQLLSGGRFRLGLGSGEILNEHVTGGGWKVNAELPGPAAFATASRFVRPRDVATSTFNDPAIAAIATAHGKTPAQVMIRWHLQEGRSAIPKSVRPERIAENFDVFDFELSTDELATLDKLDTGVRGGPEPKDITLENFGREIPEA